MHDALHVGRGITARAQQSGNALEIGDALEVHRALFAAEASIEIGPEPAMTRVAGELADVIDVVHHLFELQAGPRRSGLPANPVWNHHPGVKRRANDGAALD